MPIARSSLAGATTGVVLLAGALGLGVGLPKITDEQYSSSAELPVLPDQLGEKFVAIAAATPEQAGASSPEEIDRLKKDSAAILAQEATVSDKLSEMYGDAVARGYFDPETRASIVLTVATDDAGLLIPRGVGDFDDPQTLTHYRLQTIEGFQCATTWVDPIDPNTGQPTGQPATAADYAVECQGERDGLVFDVSSDGLLPEDTVSYLEVAMELDS